MVFNILLSHQWLPSTRKEQRCSSVFKHDISFVLNLSCVKTVWAMTYYDVFYETCSQDQLGKTLKLTLWSSMFLRRCSIDNQDQVTVSLTIKKRRVEIHCTRSRFKLQTGICSGSYEPVMAPRLHFFYFFPFYQYPSIPHLHTHRFFVGRQKLAVNSDKSRCDKIGACRAKSDSARSQNVLSGLVG